MAPVQKECDYLVIGGGSGGVASARAAAGKFGAKAIVIEGKRLGGTCVNVGCVPKKITWSAAAISETISEAAHYGFAVQRTSPFDWSTFVQKRAAYIERLNGIYEKNLGNENVEYMPGFAKFVSKDTVEVKLNDGSTTTVKGKHILIAVGGRPAKPTTEGAELGIDSDGFFELEKQPKVAALVGAGYIAVEMAGMLHHLGTETHLFIRHDNFLRPFDSIIQETLMKEYERQGIKIHKNSKQTKVEKHPSKEGWSIVHYTDSDNPNGATLEVETLLWAIGRQPETDNLGLEHTGVKTNDKGVITVDEYENTSTPNIYSLGDVVGKVELTPVAIAAGRRLAARLFGNQPNAKLDYNNIPSVIFAHPEAGSIGLTEAAAREKFGDDKIKVYKSSFTSLYYSMMPQEEKAPAAYKLVCNGPEEKVVGMHIVGKDSAEILQGFGVAIKMGATKADFDNCVAIHPTNAEEVVTMK